MSRTVRVSLGTRGYDVRIGSGLLAGAGEALAPLAAAHRVVVVTDSTVAALHAPILLGALDAASLRCAGLIEVPPGEGAKSFVELERLCDAWLALELDRGDLVVAFGGGVVGDLAGFAAAIYKRGVDFVQIPTTLLAQVDSSVGGKTAIDTPRGKNLIGAFHQPRLVLADLDVLRTLPARELRAGFAEMLKHGLLGDADYFATLDAAADAIVRRRDPEALETAIARSVELKAQIVAEDETERGRRALLNLGHTFGHAWETEAAALTGDASRLIHGEAVALGCAQAMRFSAALGLCPAASATRAAAAFGAAGLPVRVEELALPPVSAERLLAHMTQDKKAVAGRLTLVLAHEVGRAFVTPDVDRIALRTFLLAEGAV